MGYKVVPFLGLPYRILNISHKKETTLEPMGRAQGQVGPLFLHSTVWGL